MDAARAHFGPDCSVTLFGSRGDDTRRGGDTDLMVETTLSTKEAVQERVAFLVDVKKRIGNRRIDVVVRARDSKPKLIYEVAENDSVPLT